jgi:hypothetical protein
MTTRRDVLRIGAKDESDSGRHGPDTLAWFQIAVRGAASKKPRAGLDPQKEAEPLRSWHVGGGSSAPQVRKPEIIWRRERPSKPFQIPSFS